MKTVPPETQQNTTWWRGPQVALTTVAVTVVVVLAVFAVVRLTDSDTVLESGASVDDPASVIQATVAAYNAGDIDAVMALFTEQSVVTNHPFSINSRGITDIRSLQEEDRAAAAEVNPYEIFNVQVTGNTVTWDHVWTNDLTQDWCAEGHRAVIEDGKILSWDFAPNPHRCP